MTRKALSCLLTVALLFSVSLTGFSGISFAASDVELSVAGGNLLIYEGELGATTVAVNLDKNVGMQALSVRLEYDPTYLKITGYQNGSTWTDSQQFFTENAQDLQVDYFYITDTEFSGTGELFTVNFQATEEALESDATEYPLNLVVDTCQNKKGVNLTSAVTNNVITVTNVNKILAKAATALEQASYTVPQADPDMAATITKAAQAVLAGDTQFAQVSVGNVVPGITKVAVAGDADYPDGTDGEFNFTADLAYAGTTATKTTNDIDGIVKATHYSGKTNPELVAEAKAAIEANTFTVQQSEANSADALPAALIAPINSLITATGVSVSVTDIAITECIPAIAGTAEKVEGTNGSFAAEIHLVLGKTGNGYAVIANSKGIIQATSYDLVLAKALTWLSNSTLSYSQAEVEAAIEAGTAEKLLAEDLYNRISAEGIEIDQLQASDIAPDYAKYVAAVAGNADKPLGSDGSFEFKVTFNHAGNTAVSSAKSGTIIATAYSGPTNEQAIKAAEQVILDLTSSGSAVVDLPPGAYKDQDLINGFVYIYLSGLCNGLPEVVAVNGLDEIIATYASNVGNYYNYAVSLTKGSHKVNSSFGTNLRYIDEVKVIKNATDDQKRVECEIYAKELIKKHILLADYEFISADKNEETGLYDVIIANATTGDIFAFVLEVKESYGLEITVKDTAGKDLPGVKVETEKFGGITNSSGIYTELGIPAGTYKLWLTLPSGYELTKELVVLEEQNTSVAYQIPYTTVIAQDKLYEKMAGVYLTIYDCQTGGTYEGQTDSSGQYTWLGIPAGNYNIRLATPGGTILDNSITIKDSEDTNAIYILSQEGISLITQVSPDARKIAVGNLDGMLDNEDIIGEAEWAILNSGGKVDLLYALQTYPDPSQLVSEDKADFDTIMNSGLLEAANLTWTADVTKFLEPKGGTATSSGILDTGGLVETKMSVGNGTPVLFRVHMDGLGTKYLDVVSLNGADNARYLITNGIADTSKNLGLNTGEKLEIDGSTLKIYTRYNSVYVLGGVPIVEYDIKTSSTGCTITADSKAEAGDTVNFTITPSSGYKLNSGYPTVTTANGEKVTTTLVSTNKYLFTMPNADVTIAAKCTKSGGGGGGGGGSGSGNNYYKLSVDKATGGTVTAATSNGSIKVSNGGNNKNVAGGWDITVTVKAKEGYALDTIKVTNTDNSSDEIDVSKRSDGTYGFNMPNHDTTVTCTFVETGEEYTATISKPEGGTITASFAGGDKFTTSGEVRSGLTVTLTPKANSGYSLSTIKVTNAKGAEVATTKTSKGTYTFKMPESDVTIAATFTGGSTTTPTEPTAPAEPTTPTTPTTPAVGHQAYLSGFTDGNFYPQNNMTRAQVAAMFYSVLPTKDLTSDKTFSDVPADAWYAPAVNAMAALGAVNGYADGTFKPEAPVTRAELVTMAINLLGQADSEATCDFVDVPATHWAYVNIATASANGWLSGYSDNTFRPDNNITRAEVATIGNKVLGRTADPAIAYTSKFADVTDTSYWAYYEIMEATVDHEVSAHSN